MSTPLKHGLSPECSGCKSSDFGYGYDMELNFLHVTHWCLTCSI